MYVCVCGYFLTMKRVALNNLYAQTEFFVSIHGPGFSGTIIKLPSGDLLQKVSYPLKKVNTLSATGLKCIKLEQVSVKIK